MNKDLALYRLEMAKENLKSAEILLREKQYKKSVSCSYYAMFSAAKSLLALRELNSARHSGVLALFNQHFVKEGKVPHDLSRILADAKEIREEGDYGDFVTVTPQEADTQVTNAKYFIEKITEIVNTFSQPTDWLVWGDKWGRIWVHQAGQTNNDRDDT